MKKILFVATIDQHIRHFHIPYLEYFHNNGYEVHVASNGDENLEFVDIKYNIEFDRSPFSSNNIIAYQSLKKIINENNFDLVHCHTPVGGVITRLVARNSKSLTTKFVYTAHGFHFYRGAPIKNWLLFYPIEKYLSKYTDCLIAINEEDYEIARRKFKMSSIKHINGVGVNLNKFRPVLSEEKLSLREEYGFNVEDVILVYVGELSYRKHQDVLIRAMESLVKKIPNAKLLLVGMGPKEDEYINLINELKVNESIKLMGYRSDVDKIMMLSDICVSSSRQEGLPVNIIEAMATSLPLVVSNCRGNRDLIVDGTNGFIIENDTPEEYVDKIIKLLSEEKLYYQVKNENKKRAEKYSIERIREDFTVVYSELLID